MNLKLRKLWLKLEAPLYMIVDVLFHISNCIVLGISTAYEHVIFRILVDYGMSQGSAYVLVSVLPWMFFFMGLTCGLVFLIRIFKVSDNNQQTLIEIWEDEQNKSPEE